MVGRAACGSDEADRPRNRRDLLALSHCPTQGPAGRYRPTQRLHEGPERLSTRISTRGREDGCGEERRPRNFLSYLVREGGVEPPRAFAHWILSPARLPVSPLSRALRRTMLAKTYPRMSHCLISGYREFCHHLAAVVGE